MNDPLNTTAWGDLCMSGPHRRTWRDHMRVLWQWLRSPDF